MDSDMAGFCGSNDVREAVFPLHLLSLLFSVCEVILSHHREDSS